MKLTKKYRIGGNKNNKEIKTDPEKDGTNSITTTNKPEISFYESDDYNDILNKISELNLTIITEDEEELMREE